jgi:hypothetical protein
MIGYSWVFSCIAALNGFLLVAGDEERIVVVGT